MSTSEKPRTTKLPRIIDSLDREILDKYPALRHYAQKLGRTPLIEVPSKPGSARIFAKCEWYNPTGSVKDRVAFAMLYQLLSKKRDIDPTSLHILEYSGGNLAISLSQICSSLSISCTLVLGSYTPSAVVADLESKGSKVILVEKEKGFWGVMKCAIDMAEQNPDWHFLYQHINDANLWVHRTTTGREILVQLGHVADAKSGRKLKIDAWVASIGTGGTLIGVHEALLSENPRLKLYAVSPSELPYGSDLPPNGLPKFSGSGGLGSGCKQQFVAAREHHIVKHFSYSFSESLNAVRDFAAKTNFQIGTSAAANLMAAQEIADDLGEGKVVVTLFPSLATDDEWMKANS